MKRINYEIQMMMGMKIGFEMEKIRKKRLLKYLVINSIYQFLIVLSKI